jgi:hypothetical protein
MNEYSDYYEWVRAGRAAGYAGPFRLQGLNKWQFTFRGEVIGVWSEARGRMGNQTLAKPS